MKMKRDPSVGLYVGMLHRYSKMHFSQLVEPLGIPELALPYLVALFHEDDVSQDEIAKFQHKDKATVARALAKLETAGFVARREDSEDRRIKRVRLTAKAKRFRPKLERILRDWSNTLTQGFTKKERIAVMRLLERMAQNARTAVRESDR